MVNISIEALGIRELQADLTDLRDKADAIAAGTITKLAVYTKNRVYDTMRQVFNSPVPYTMNSLYAKPAKESDLSAKVWFRPITRLAGGHYIEPQVTGGTRRQKPFEWWLTQYGYLPPGWFAVPVSGARIDSNGNVSPGQYVEILSALGIAAGSGAATRVRGATRRMTRLGLKYFAVKMGSPASRYIRPGIYMYQSTAFGRAIRPVFIFTSKANYNKLLPFYEIGERVTENNLREFWEQELRQTRLLQNR